MGADLHIDYVAWGFVGALGVACAWVLSRKPAEDAIPPLWFGLAGIVISVFLALAGGMRGESLVIHLALRYSPFPGIVGHAANKTLIIGYGSLLAAILHALAWCVRRSRQQRA
jgi:hypothetical protein